MHVLFFAKFCIRQATHWTTQDKGKRDQKRANYPTNEIKAVIWFLLLLHNDRAVWLEALNMDFLQTWLFQFDDSDMTAFQSRWIYVSIVVLYSLGAGKQTRAHTHTPQLTHAGISIKPSNTCGCCNLERITMPTNSRLLWKFWGSPGSVAQQDLLTGKGNVDFFNGAAKSVQNGLECANQMCSHPSISTVWS